MANILLLHGPNLNLLGRRQPDIYGKVSLEQINQSLRERCIEKGHQLEVMQSNAEHELIERIQHTYHEDIHFIIINPAAFTHTSIALRDALAAANLPFIECHISNIHAREPFRRNSYFSDLAVGVVAGFGAYSYELALSATFKELDKT